MNLNDLPREILTHCFSYLSTELLTNIILLDNIPDNMLEAAADNLNHLWYANKLLQVEENAIFEDHYETSFDYHQIASDRYYLETEIDRFLNIHKVLEKKSIKRPLWFHYKWENVFEMRRDLDEINSAFKGQKLGLSADLEEIPYDGVRLISHHDINLKITYLSVWNTDTVNLNDFPKLETFFTNGSYVGRGPQIIVDQDHPSLKTLYLQLATFSSLPVDLERLVSRYCHITMKKDHPKLEGLRVLVLQDINPGDGPFLLRKLWNKDLETFTYIEKVLFNDDRDEVINLDDIMSMIGPKVKNFGFASSSFSGIPTLLRSLHSDDSRNESSENHIRQFDLTAFTHMTSLTLNLPKGLIDTLKLPPNLLKLSIYKATFQDLERISFPSRIVDLHLSRCGITLTDGWLNTARLKLLSLENNKLSSFRAFLPCCEYLSLRCNPLTDLEIEAPLLEHIDLFSTEFKSIPKLPHSLQELVFGNSDLRLSGMPELPSSLRVLAFWGNLDLQDYTFPPSIEELDLGNIEWLEMSGVKFAKGSRLKELILSGSSLPSIVENDETTEDYRYIHNGFDITTIDDGNIELPPGLKALKMRGMNLRYIDDLTIPQSVTFLDLRENVLRSFEVKSHIETLYLGDNPTKHPEFAEDYSEDAHGDGKLNFVVHKDLELRVLDLADIGLTEFSFDMVRAEKLSQLCLDHKLEKIDLSNMPVDFQILRYRGVKEIEGLHRYPDTKIYTRLP